MPDGAFQHLMPGRAAEISRNLAREILVFRRRPPRLESRAHRVAEIGDVHSLTPAQVIFCLALELGMLPLTGTTDAVHMDAALACQTGVLTAAEVAELEAIALRQG